MTQQRSSARPLRSRWLITALLGVAVPASAVQVASAAPPSEASTPSTTTGDNARLHAVPDDAGPLREGLEHARAETKDDPTQTSTLHDAIAKADANPAALRRDPELRDARSLARLELVRAALAMNDEAAATAAAQDALRLEPDALRFADRLGPTVASFVRARAETPRPSATLDVTCTTPCTVFVDEHPRSTGPIQVDAGAHRLFVDGPGAVGLALALDLAANEHHAATWPIAVADRAADEQITPPPRPARLLPRGAELALFSVGLGLTGTGAALLVLDGRCPGGDDPSDVMACPNVYATRPAGGATLALGITSALTGLIPLAIDEARQARHRRAQRRTLEAEAKALSRR